MRRVAHAAMAALALIAVAPGGLARGAVPRSLTSIAERSVGSVRTDSGSGTAFAIGAAGRVVTAGISQGTGNIRLTSATGAGAQVTVRKSSNGVSILEPAGKLRPLAPYRRSVRNGARLWVLGGPVGYASRKVREARAKASGTGRSRHVVLEGDLPANASGAPVVTSRGAVVGLVARRATPRRALVPVATVQHVLASADKPGGSLPGWALPAVALAVLLLVAVVAVVATIAAAKRRRRNAASLHPPDSAPDSPTEVLLPAQPAPPASEPVPVGPLVQRREPPSAPFPDFEIVIRSREEGS